VRADRPKFGPDRSAYRGSTDFSGSPLTVRRRLAAVASDATLIGSVVAVLADAALVEPCDEGAEGIAAVNAMLNRVPPLASPSTDAVNVVASDSAG
jgi:hypothetical protein